MLALKGPTLGCVADLPPFIAGTFARPEWAPSPGSSSQVLETLWPKGTVQALDRDREIYAEGDPAESWYRLRSGTMRVFRVLADGRRHIGEFVFPGQVFGFEPGRVHIQGAEAVEPATVIAYSHAAIEQRMAHDNQARHAISALLIERLAAAQERVLMLGSLSAGERLAEFLLAMARRAQGGRAGMPRMAALPMSRVDIADYLGLTVETVSRLFTALRRQGVIRLAAANRVEILDPAALRAASGNAAAIHAPARDDEGLPLLRCA